MTTNKIVGERAVLFVLIGWATNYDGSEPVHGSHSYLQEHPQDNSEASAFSERKDGFFYCGAGRGAISENVLDVVFVARNETTSKYQVVGFYEEAEVLPESDDEWKTVKSKSVWLYPPQKRPEIDWPAGQATRRWARRVNGNGKQHDALYKLFINLGKPDGTSRNIDTDPELSAFEGTKKERFILHRTRESKLRSAKIRSALEKGSGRLCCQVPRCGFDFYDKYGEIGHKFAIVHHLSPLGLAHEDGVNTTLDELAIVCANCHAMIHRGGECRELSTLIPE